MYKDLKKNFWRNGMKKHIADFIMRCTESYKIKAKHQCLGGYPQSIEIPKWKWN